MGKARLVVFYRIDGDERLYYAWKRINLEENAAREVVKLVKSLPDWEHSRLYCLGKGEAYFAKGNEHDGTYGRLSVNYYVGHEDEITITREEFCRIVDVLLKDAPTHIRQFFQDFTNDPETADYEVQEVADIMFEKLATPANMTQ